MATAPLPHPQLQPQRQQHFDSALDAILHYYPLGDSHHTFETPIRVSPPTISTTTVSASFGPNSRSTHSSSIDTISPLALPLPYIHPLPDLNLPTTRFLSNRNMSPSRPQVQQPAPRRPTPTASPDSLLNHNRASMDISPSRNTLSAPRATRSGSSPSRSPYHGITALSPLQGMQPMSISKTASSVAESPVRPHSELPPRPETLGRIPSRRQSMLQSAASWQMGQRDENQQDRGTQTSRLVICKSPKEDEGGFGKV
jgi:hypothetical protein